MKVSIITAVFNREATIAEALASLRTQTHPDLEHIIIDGGSTDATLTVIKAHAGTRAVVVSVSARRPGRHRCGARRARRQRGRILLAHALVAAGADAEIGG